MLLSDCLGSRCLYAPPRHSKTPDMEERLPLKFHLAFRLACLLRPLLVIWAVLLLLFLVLFLLLGGVLCLEDLTAAAADVKEFLEVLV